MYAIVGRGGQKGVDHASSTCSAGRRRLVGIEIDTCARCGGKLKVIASIEGPQVIATILAHLEKTSPDERQVELPLAARAPPTQARLIWTVPRLRSSHRRVLHDDVVAC